MKSFTKLLVAFTLLVLYNSVQVFGQCTSSPNNGQFPAATVALNTSCIPTVLTTAAYTAEYSVVSTVTANATYSITSTYTSGGTATGDYITITESDGTTVVAFGASPFTWTAPATPSANYRLYRHLPGPPTCGEENVNRTIRATCTTCSPAGPVACVTNSAPANNATGVSLTPTLSWAANTNAVSYEVFLGTSVGTAASLGVVTGTSLVLTMAANLQFNTTYFWYIVPTGCDNIAASGCSANATSFTTSAGAPVNDECANATALTVNTDGTCAITTAGTINSATASAGAPTSACGTYDDDVWFSFVAAGPTQLFTLTPGTGVTDYTHQIISGTCGSLTALVCSDPNTSSYTGFVAGTTYYVRVASWTSTTGQLGTFTLCVRTPPPPPANDECAGAVAVTVNPTTACTAFTAGTVAAASASTGPTSTCGTYDDDVWYSFVATAAVHTVTLQNIVGSTTDMTHQVLSGPCGAQVAVVCSDPNASTATGLTVGATYYIRVASWTSTTGQTSTFELCVGTAPSMTYVSSVATQQTGTVGAGSVNQAILRLDVVAIGQNNLLSVTDFSFNTNGTSVPADILNAKIYYTGTSTTFANTTLFGSAATPNGTFNISGSQVLTGGATNTTNYFWLTYDLVCGAVGPNLDAEWTGFTIGGSPQVPSTTAPAGNRTVTALSSFNTAAAGSWSNPATWGCGVPPNGTTIAVNVNHNVTLDVTLDLQSTLTIGTGGTLNLNGNTLNVGTTGTATPQNVSITGTLNVNNGTLNVGTATTVAASNIVVNAGGTFTAANGTVNLGPTGGYNRTFSTAAATSTCNFTGGTININGNILFTNGVINISGGTITVDGNGPSSVAASTDLVRFGSTSTGITINGTGGTIIVVDPHASSSSTTNRAVAVSVSSANSGATSLSGVTFQFGDGVSTTAGNTSGFNFDTYVSTKNVPLGNVIVNGGSSATRFVSGTGSSGNAADIYGSLTINADSEVRTIGATTGVGIGVYGNIINNGTFTVSSATLATLYLGGKQVGSPPAANLSQSISGGGLWRNNTTTASATASINNMAMNNTAGTTLQVPLSVGGTLTLTNGKIFTSEANFLAIGTGILPNTGTIGTATVTPTTTTAASHVVGPVHRTIPSAVTWTVTDQRGLFPVGDGAAARQLNVAVTAAATSAGTLVAEYKNSDPGVPAAEFADGGINIQQTSPTGFWNIERDNGNTGGTHTVQANATGFTKRTGGAITDLANIRLIKRATGGSWEAGADGNAAAPTGLSAVSRASVTAFSDFGIGGTFGALPIELKSFTGKVLKSSNQLEWVTSTEQNVREHVIERSFDGFSNWTMVGSMLSKGESREEQFYSLEDKAPLAKAFYRLRSVDHDGKEQLSGIISLTRLNNSFGVVSAYPNPATESINIDVNSLEEGMVVANIMDMTGRLIQQQQMSVEKGINTMTLSLFHLGAGTYYISLQNEKEVTTPVRFVKQ